MAMIANRREKLLLIVTVSAVVLWILDAWWLGPLLERAESVDKAHVTAKLKLDKLRNTASTKPRQVRALKDIEEELQALKAAGAELEFDSQLSELASKAGALSRQVRYVKTESVDVYNQVVYSLNLEADIKALRRYLFALDSLPLPLKISNLTINRANRSDRLRVTMTVSTLSLADDDGAPRGNGRNG
jgi:cell division protein FtsB